MTSNLLVLGTDTDAGKTTVSLLLLAAYPARWEYWKPLETGVSDTATVHRLVPDAIVHPVLLRLSDPVAPPLAARREGRVIPPAAEIVRSLPARIHSERGMLIETFGGPFSPLNEQELQLALIQEFRCPAILVTSSAVGAIGRSLAALTALATLGVQPRAVVLIGPVDEYAEAEIRKHSPGMPVISLQLPQEWTVAGITAAVRGQVAMLTELQQSIDSPARQSSGCQDRGEAWLAADAATIWHPYSSLRPVRRPWPVVGAEAEYLHLADGRRLIDAISSWWTILHGHRDPRLMAALHAASLRIDHVLFAGVTHPDAVLFAKRILATCPWTGGRVFFSDNGSTAVEVALKMAYQFWCHRGEPHRQLFVGFDKAYHGDTFGAMAVGRDRLFFGPFEPLLFRAVQLPLDPNRLDELLQQRANEIAAVIVEPLVQGAGGMRMHSPEVLRDLHTVTRKHGLLLIADEVMTGTRTGTRWAFQQAGIAPDLICAAKTLAGGILPLAVTLAGPSIVAAFDTADRTRSFFHGHSFTAHPLACAVAAENEARLAEPGVLARANDIGKTVFTALQKVSELPQVKEIRQCGSIVAVELNVEGGYLTTEAERWARIAADWGVFLRPLGNVLYALPPLATSEESLLKIAEALRAAIEYTEGKSV